MEPHPEKAFVIYTKKTMPKRQRTSRQVQGARTGENSCLLLSGRSSFRRSFRPCVLSVHGCMHGWVHACKHACMCLPVRLAVSARLANGAGRRPPPMGFLFCVKNLRQRREPQNNLTGLSCLFFVCSWQDLAKLRTRDCEFGLN